MSGMFLGTATFNEDISAWDVSNVNDMASMFQDSAPSTRISQGGVQLRGGLTLGTCSKMPRHSSLISPTVDMLPALHLLPAVHAKRRLPTGALPTSSMARPMRGRSILWSSPLQPWHPLPRYAMAITHPQRAAKPARNVTNSAGTSRRCPNRRRRRRLETFGARHANAAGTADAHKGTITVEWFTRMHYQACVVL